MFTYERLTIYKFYSIFVNSAATSFQHFWAKGKNFTGLPVVEECSQSIKKPANVKNIQKRAKHVLSQKKMSRIERNKFSIIVNCSIVMHFSISTIFNF